jgi:hypothetical protein
MGNIIQKATVEILKGRGHQEIFNEIVSQTDLDIHKVAENIRKIPTLEKRKKYHSLNIILATGIGINAFINIIFILFNDGIIGSLMPSIIGFGLLYGVVKYKSNMHLAVGFCLFAGTISLIVKVLLDFNFVYLFFIGFSMAMAITAFYLSSKLVSDYSINKVLRNNNPNQRVDSLIFID